MARSTLFDDAVPPLPVLSVWFAVFGSASAAVALAPLASEAIVHGRAEQAPLTLVMVRFVGVSVTWIDVAVDGPAVATTSVYATVPHCTYGPAVVSVFTIATSAAAAAVPPLPVLSVLFARLESVSAGVAVAVLSKAPAAMIVAATLIVVFAPDASEAIVHGSAEQAPLAVPMVMFVGVSVTWIDVAVDGPAFATTSV